MALNTDKLRRVRDNLTSRQRDLIDALPLLFSTNEPSLPGYVAGDTPVGVCDYTPGPSALQAAGRLAKSFRYEGGRQKSQRSLIEGLYLMGSPGTVGYSKSSDFDIWLVHDPKLGGSPLEALQDKAKRIEALAASLGLEMHFFVFDAQGFRSGETLTLSDESSGSSQHYLLLDEFYRSGLLLAGLKPMWWFVPPEDENHYDDYVAEACKSGTRPGLDYVDFGGLTDIPAAEFFGAAVWQLYKSIDSPYKSVLKLLLVEAYAADFPNGQFLSDRYKAAIARGQVSLDEIDPYILMYRKVEEYLIALGDTERLDLMRRSFYIKTNVQLSKSRESRVPNWQRETLQRMARDWNWSATDIRRLDDRKNWKVAFASNERRVLIKALRQSYAALSKFASGHGQDQNISQRDLNILGRKLYAAFERKPSKIDIVTRGICPDPAESELSLHCAAEGNGEPVWKLYAGSIEPKKLGHSKPLNRGKSPTEILAWCHFNHLITEETIWRIHDSNMRLTYDDVHKVIELINHRFPDQRVTASEATALDAVPRVTRALMMINVGVDPLVGKVLEGGVLTSNQTDAFQFGGQRINLIGSVDLLMMTSWEEVFVFRFSGASALLEALMEYLQWATPLGSYMPPSIDIFSLSKTYDRAIIGRVQGFVSDLINRMCSKSADVDRQLVVQISNRYYRTYTENDKPRFEAHQSYAALLKAIGAPRQTYCDIEFDLGCRAVGILRCIYDHNVADQIQLFIHEDGSEADVYVLDAFGALFTHRQECYSIELMFDQYLKFLQNLTKYDAPNREAFDPVFGLQAVELYRLQRQSNDVFNARKAQSNSTINPPFLPIGVFVDIDDAGNQQFTMFCEEEKFSSLEHGARIFAEIAAFIYACRGNSETYPIYITDLELSNRFKSMHAGGDQTTIQLLNYKKRIEQHLTQALRDNVSKADGTIAAG